jgi:hypothetical protein
MLIYAFHAIRFATEDQTDDHRTAYRDSRRQLIYGTFYVFQFQFVLVLLLLEMTKRLVLATIFGA